MSRSKIAQFYFLAIKSPNGFIYVTIYSHLYRIFVALCGSNGTRVRDGFNLGGFLSHKNVLHV